MKSTCNSNKIKNKKNNVTLHYYHNNSEYDHLYTLENKELKLKKINEFAANLHKKITKTIEINKNFKHYGLGYYKGEMIGGVPNGKGIEYNGLGNVKYDGGFKNGKYDGKGIEYNELGKVRYNGEFKNGKYDGKGIEYNELGNVIYNGEFKNDWRDGKGIEYNELGKVRYNGEFKNGWRDGKGIEYNELGNVRYNGEFKKNQYYGRGKYYYGNHLAYEGEFRDGNFDGLGKRYHRGIIADPQIVEGRFAGNHANGHCIVTNMNDNSKMECIMKNDIPEGIAKITNADGTQWQQHYHHGIPVGPAQQIVNQPNNNQVNNNLNNGQRQNQAQAGH